MCVCARCKRQLRLLCAFFYEETRPQQGASFFSTFLHHNTSPLRNNINKKYKKKREMSYRLSNISRQMARFMRTHSSSSSSARGSSNSSSMNSSMNSSSSSSSSSRQKQIFCNNNSSNCNGFGIVSRPTNTNIGIGSLRSFADIAAAQKNTQLNARVVAFALEALKLEAATTTARTNLNLVDLDEIILSTDSIGLFEEIEDT